MFACFRVGARDYDDRACLAAVRDELLGPVQHEVVAVTARRGAERRGIGSGVGLGKQECANLVAARHRRKKTLPLRSAAVPSYRIRGDIVNVDDGSDARIGRRDLFDCQAIGQKAGTGAAVFFR